MANWQKNKTRTEKSHLPVAFLPFSPLPICLFAYCLLMLSCNNKPHEIIGENEFYICSMDPQVMEKQPGLCPICKMPLAKAVINKSEMQLVKLNEEQMKLANIKTDTVKTNQIWEEKTLTGIFALNQNFVQQISSRFSGRIEKLHYKIPGQEIKQGEWVYEVYSRDLILAQEEYLFALDKSVRLPGNSSPTNLIESAKLKLLLWGLTEQQIKTLEEEKKAKIVMPIFSTVSGTIMEIPQREGTYIDEGSTIYKLADLSALWVEAQIYSNEIDLLQKTKKVEIIPEAFPDIVLKGEIDFSNPVFEPATKINLLRIKIQNVNGKFLPGMMAFVILKSNPKTAITLPLDAVIQNGKISLVWLKNKDGNFIAKSVITGIQTKTKIEIINGLNTGDVVVTSGAYLIYSDYVFKKGIQPLSSDSSSKVNMVEMKDM